MSMTTNLEIRNKTKAERVKAAHDHACHRDGKMNVIDKGPPLHDTSDRVANPEKLKG